MCASCNLIQHAVYFLATFSRSKCTVAHKCKHNNILETQQTIFGTQHNIIETQHNFIETQHNIWETQHFLFSKFMQNLCYYTTYKRIITQPLTFYAPCKTLPFLVAILLSQNVLCQLWNWVKISLQML